MLGRPLKGMGLNRSIRGELRWRAVLQLTQRIDFLGFRLGLINMVVSLTDRKVDRIRSVCAELLEMEVCSI